MQIKTLWLYAGLFSILFGACEAGIDGDCVGDDCNDIFNGPGVVVNGENCANFGDDDRDGLTDCDDPDCANNNACTPGNRQTGDACVSANQCDTNNNNDPICLDETTTGFPAGSCAEFCERNFDPNTGIITDDGCLGDSVCAFFSIPFSNAKGRANFRSGICMDSCQVDSDCRDGYSCLRHLQSDGDVRICWPTCTDDDQCGETDHCNPFESGFDMSDPINNISGGRCNDDPEICDDGIDNDGDSNNNGNFIDCDDQECFDDAVCQ